MDPDVKLKMAAKTADAIVNAFEKQKFSSVLIVFRPTSEGLADMGFVVSSGDIKLAIEAMREAANRVTDEL